jgi:hypothetical protein
MLDLISTTEELHYEHYRQQQLETRKPGEPRPRKGDNLKFKEEEEALRKRFTEQVKQEELRFRQWEQHVSGVKLKLEDHHADDAHSSLRNVIASTRTSSSLTARSRALRPSLTVSRQATAVPAGDDHFMRISSAPSGYCGQMYTPTLLWIFTLVWFAPSEADADLMEQNFDARVLEIQYNTKSVIEFGHRTHECPRRTTSECPEACRPR